jgi:hypothetical protein
MVPEALMRRLFQIVFAISILLGASFAIVDGASGADDLPRAFSECVIDGGDVRSEAGDVTCRLVRAYDFRVYGSGTTECGEQIALEVWGETRRGVVTYLFDPGRTVELPEVGKEGMVLPEAPLKCLGD